MKRYRLFIAVCLFIFCLPAKSLTQQNDSTAHSIIQENLSIISKYLKDINSDPSLKRVRAISFLTNLTDIPSNSDGNYVGQLSPTEYDFALWERWYENNKNNIIWDEKNLTIIVTKRLNVSRYMPKDH